MDTDIQPLSFYHRAIFCVVNVSMSVREQELRFAPFCLPLINIILLIYSSSSSFFCASLRLLIFSPLSLLSCSLAYPLHFPLPPLLLEFCWVHNEHSNLPLQYLFRMGESSILHTFGKASCKYLRDSMRIEEFRSYLVYISGCNTMFEWRYSMYVKQ